MHIYNSRDLRKPVLRQPNAATLFVMMMAVAAAFAKGGRRAVSEESIPGILNGQVGTPNGEGGVVPPESSTVYVFFSSTLERRHSLSRPDGLSIAIQQFDSDTAGGQFHLQLNKLLEKNKDLKRLEKTARHNPRPDDANQIAAYFLQSVDEALTWVQGWLTKHPDRAWQMKALTPDRRGLWSAEGLRPGEYEVVVRGKLSGYDADWEATVDLDPGRTVSLPLTRPRFFRHE
jgi:hypothetical protein